MTASRSERPVHAALCRDGARAPAAVVPSTGGASRAEGAAPAISSPLRVEQLPIADLHPDPGNPRRIGEAELAALTRSIATFGVVDPVLARRADRRVIAGHQRLVAARRAGLTTVPVILSGRPSWVQSMQSMHIGRH